MIEITNLYKYYNDKKHSKLILNNINLTINNGEIFGIIGKSGAGKSTLLKCFNLLAKPDQGSIKIDNVELTSLSEFDLRLMRQKIGVIFQNFNLLHKTVFDNVALPLYLNSKLNRIQIKDKVYSMLELVGLSKLYNKYPHELSGGEKQRVGIARALIMGSQILLSDEATSALDSETTNNILNLYLELNKNLNVTIVLITHELDVVRKVCDRVAVINQGEIVECDSTTNIILHPKHELTKSLVREEGVNKYLELISNFYQFNKGTNNHLLMLYFIGEQTFSPVLSQIIHQAQLEFSILKGEIGRIKNTPFGQLLIEVVGKEEDFSKAFSILNQLNIYYEILH